MPTKNNFLKLFSFFLFRVHLHHSSKRKSHKERSHKRVEIKVFFLLFNLMMEGFESVQIMTDPDPEDQKHKDPTEPDPGPSGTLEIVML
jgi:hypothetical protein